MKREISFFRDRRHRTLNAKDLIATLRMLGMTDEQIKAEMLKLKAEQKQGWQGPRSAQPPKAER